VLSSVLFSGKVLVAARLRCDSVVCILISGNLPSAKMTIMSLASVRLFTFVLTLSLPIWSFEKERKPQGCPSSERQFAALHGKAEGGDARAQAALASCYELGKHVPPGRTETIHWLTLSAEQSYAPAEYELGRIYLYGRGIPADYAKARQWLKKAADQGHRQAERDMAFVYERGLGVEADPVEAASWNRKAAQQGEPVAQLRLAQALETGTGLPADAAESKEWYRRAAKLGLAAAQLRLARLYDREGNGAARAWYERAAEGGDAPAMYELGKLYQSGRYVTADRERAYFWYQLGGRF